VKLLSAIAREILGLFVDDGALALHILGVVCTAGVALLLGLPNPWVGGLLLFGLLFVLAESVHRASRR
jgi:hypothetical protein